jgi:hypothetical protein
VHANSVHTDQNSPASEPSSPDSLQAAVENLEFSNLAFEQRVQFRQQEGSTYILQEYELDILLEASQREAAAARELRVQQRRAEGRNTAKNQRRRERRRENRVNLQQQNIELKNRVKEMNRAPPFRSSRNRSRSRAGSPRRYFRSTVDPYQDFPDQGHPETGDPVSKDAMPHERNAMLSLEGTSRNAMPHVRNAPGKITQSQLEPLQLDTLQGREEISRNAMPHGRNAPEKITQSHLESSHLELLDGINRHMELILYLQDTIS